MTPERSWQRQSCFEPCWAEVDGTGERLSCHVLDYSFTGVRLGIDRSLPPGTRLNVQLQDKAPGALTSLLVRPATVAWCRPTPESEGWFFEVGLEVSPALSSQRREPLPKV